MQMVSDGFQKPLRYDIPKGTTV